MENTAQFFPFMGVIRVRTTYEFRGRRLDDEELRSKEQITSGHPADQP
jgi:hypothetical protein